MGLRERKAQRTRVSAVDAALTLFDRQGYDATTMEQIAEASEVSTSTLYRYFRSKEELLLAPFSEWDGHLAHALHGRPADEPPTVALAHAIDDVLVEAEASGNLMLRLRAAVDRAPVARARLWDIWNRERELVRDELGRRLGVPDDDPTVVLAAHIAVEIVGIALDTWRDHLDRPRPTEVARDYLELLNANPLLPGR